MNEIISGILGTGNPCPKCGEEMVLSGKIKKKGKLREVWRCAKCNHRIVK